MHRYRGGEGQGPSGPLNGVAGGEMCGHDFFEISLTVFVTFRVVAWPRGRGSYCFW